MLSQNKKNTIARLCALTLLFSYAEMLLPRIVPFFRLGLANSAILLAFELPFPHFSLLCVLKAITSSLMAGTLLSPFFLISLAQSVFSGILMYAIFYFNHIASNKLFSRYGISVIGSVLSGFIQIALSSIYLGSGTFKLLGPVLIFNTISGIITALLADYLSENKADESKNEFLLSPIPSTQISTRNTVLQLLLLFILLSASLSVFFIKNLWVLSAFFIFSLILQKISSRKIMILPHVFMWIFIFASSIFIPNGKVILKIGFLSITQNSFFPH